MNDKHSDVIPFPRTPMNAEFPKICFKFQALLKQPETLNLKQKQQKYKMLKQFKFKIIPKLSPQQIQLMKLIQLPTQAF
jgi:hypothetical protein